MGKKPTHPNTQGHTPPDKFCERNTLRNFLISGFSITLIQACLVWSLAWTTEQRGLLGYLVFLSWLINHTNLYSSVFFIICSHLSIYCLALQNAFSLSM